MILVEVKYFEPAEGDSDDLEGHLSHPDRYRYANCWAEEQDGITYCTHVGGQGHFPFPDGFCPRFLGYYPAVILGEIDEARTHERDRIVAYRG
jgi:hypothetical protein